MGTTLAIDPGRCTGVAVSDAYGRMFACTALSEERAAQWILEVADASDWRAERNCIIEVPQIYPGERQKGDPNDLITLAVMVGRYGQIAREAGFFVTLVRPRTWKGQLPKNVCWSRVSATLTADELSIVETASRYVGESLAHNMHDAIGLLTRFQKRWK